MRYEARMSDTPEAREDLEVLLREEESFAAPEDFFEDSEFADPGI